MSIIGSTQSGRETALWSTLQRRALRVWRDEVVREAFRREVWEFTGRMATVVRAAWARAEE